MYIVVTGFTNDMGKGWNKGERTYDTDRYVERYWWKGETYQKSVWATGAYVGPGAYTRSHVCLLHASGNDIDQINDMDNPFFLNRYQMSTDFQKFKP